MRMTIDIDVPENPRGEKARLLEGAGFVVHTYSADGQPRAGVRAPEQELWSVLERIHELGIGEVVLAPWQEERYPVECRFDGFYDRRSVELFVAASRQTFQAECRIDFRRRVAPRPDRRTERLLETIRGLDFAHALSALAAALEPDPIERRVLGLESLTAELDLPFDPLDFDSQQELGLWRPHLFGSSAMVTDSPQHHQGTEWVGAYLLGTLDDGQFATILRAAAGRSASARDGPAAICYAYELLDNLVGQVEWDLEPKTGPILDQLRKLSKWQDGRGVVSVAGVEAIGYLASLRQTHRGLFSAWSRGRTEAPSFEAAMALAEDYSGAAGKWVSWTGDFEPFDRFVRLYLQALRGLGVLDPRMADEMEARYEGRLVRASGLA